MDQLKPCTNEVLGGQGGENVPLGIKGERCILIDAGGYNGFIPANKHCFISKSNSVDYHNEINGDHYGEWTETKIDWDKSSPKPSKRLCYYYG